MIGFRGIVLLSAALVLMGDAAFAASRDEPVLEAQGKGTVSYACIRVVRKSPGTPSRPKISLPAGYSLVTKGNYSAASRAEYYVFLQGPKGLAKGASIGWPGIEIEAVLHRHDRLKLRRAGKAVLCDIPVPAASPRAAWATLETWSHLSERALPIRIEHNHPDRRAGRYAEGPWVAGQAAACVNYLIACRQILRHWGLHRRIRAEKLGHLSLMGFESNNPLHGDWPAHWHLIYYWPPPAEPGKDRYHGSQVPHFYMDEHGRTTSNSIHVFGSQGRLARAGDPMIFTDPNGKVRLAIDIRRDGGVDIGPAAGRWTYSIVAGDEQGRFTKSVRVLRRGREWVRVAARDDTAAGVMTIRVDPLDGAGKPSLETYRYDPLTGRLLGKGG